MAHTMTQSVSTTTSHCPKVDKSLYLFFQRCWTFIQLGHNAGIHRQCFRNLYQTKLTQETIKLLTSTSKFAILVTLLLSSSSHRHGLRLLAALPTGSDLGDALLGNVGSGRGLAIVLVALALRRVQAVAYCYVMIWSLRMQTVIDCSTCKLFTCYCRRKSVVYKNARDFWSTAYVLANLSQCKVSYYRSHVRIQHLCQRNCRPGQGLWLTLQNLPFIQFDYRAKSGCCFSCYMRSQHGIVIPKLSFCLSCFDIVSNVMHRSSDFSQTLISPSV